jgi:hypothetical protein
MIFYWKQIKIGLKLEMTLMALTSDETRMPTPASPKKTDMRNKNEKKFIL